jgi:hypothetical protein
VSCWNSRGRCDRPVEVYVVAPDGKRVPGSYCRPCAEATVSEYKEKLGQEWTIGRLWTYEGYWNVVLGANRDAARVVDQFELTPRGLDEWLGQAEAEACAVGGIQLPVEWCGFHQQALAELEAAFEELP